MKFGEGEVGKSKAFPSSNIVLLELHLRHFQAYIITEMSVMLSSSQQSGATSTKPSILQAPRSTALHCHRSILTRSYSQSPSPTAPSLPLLHQALPRPPAWLPRPTAHPTLQPSPTTSHQNGTNAHEASKNPIFAPTRRPTYKQSYRPHRL